MTDSLILPPNSKAIPLTQGKFTIVDEADYDWLMQWKWCVARTNNKIPKYYAIRTIRIGKKTARIYMHREIGNPHELLEIDHINGDSLDNRRINLRMCTKADQARNVKFRGEKITSVYRGVCKAKKPWRGHIRIGDNKRICLGHFYTEKEAALAYNKAAIKYHGEFAVLNEIQE